MKLVIGLGNPGKQYVRTRHNIGFRILDTLCTDWKLTTRSSALICKRGELVYAKPQTFMNLSGAAVIALVQYYKIDLRDVLIVYDCKDIPFGTIRFRPKGSSGGHNGMRSIIAALGTEEFPRLRIGISPTNIAIAELETADFVLEKFSKQEEKQLPDIIAAAKLEIEKFVG